ncbi:MAG: hypothetical protein RJA35_1387 [Actinomycetota bacterium]|jgi:uroporphyrinogen-III synthase
MTSAAKPVLLIRADGNEGDAAALKAVGLESFTDPYLAIQPLPGQEGQAAAAKLLARIGTLQAGDWVIATSLNGLKAWGIKAWELTRRSAVAEAFADAKERGVRFAAIGAATAAKFGEFGVYDVFVPSEAYGLALAQQLVAEAAPEAANLNRPVRALIPAGNLAMKTLTDELAAAGWQVASEVIYETAIIPTKPETADRIGDFSAVLFRSPSAARAFAHWTRADAARSIPVVCGGRTTAAVAENLGLNVVAITPDTSGESIAATLIEATLAKPNHSIGAN